MYYFVLAVFRRTIYLAIWQILDAVQMPECFAAIVEKVQTVILPSYVGGSGDTQTNFQMGTRVKLEELLKVAMPRTILAGKKEEVCILSWE